MAPTQLRYLGNKKTLREADSEFINWTKSFKDQVESQLNKHFDTFDAVSFTTEMLAGSSYKIKVHVGDDQYIHMNVFRPLPNSNEVEKVVQIEEGRTQADELQ